MQKLYLFLFYTTSNFLHHFIDSIYKCLSAHSKMNRAYTQVVVNHLLDNAQQRWPRCATFMPNFIQHRALRIARQQFTRQQIWLKCLFNILLLLYALYEISFPLMWKKGIELNKKFLVKNQIFNGVQMQAVQSWRKKVALVRSDDQISKIWIWEQKATLKTRLK